jgi:hypothetical protein
MTINFPREEEDLSPKDGFIAYKNLADYHLHFLKQQSKCEFFYWKGLGAFFLLSMGLFVLHDHGFAFSPFLGISFIGISFLLLLAQNMRIDFEYGIKAAACVEKGLRIEKRFDYPAKIFSIFEDNKLVVYRGNLLSRLFPMGLIGLASASAGTFLAAEVSAWLAISIAVVSVVILSIAARSYIKTARKILLGE